MHCSTLLAALLSVSFTLGLALPVVDVQSAPADIIAREPRVLNPNAVTGTKCTNKAVKIDGHDINVALLQICGGIQGAIGNCRGAPQSSVGASKTAKFTIKAQTNGQTINISKGRWESCVFAARATCGDSPFTTTCIGGANGNSGNVLVTLAKQ